MACTVAEAEWLDPQSAVFRSNLRIFDSEKPSWTHLFLFMLVATVMWSR